MIALVLRASAGDNPARRVYINLAPLHAGDLPQALAGQQQYMHEGLVRLWHRLGGHPHGAQLARFKHALPLTVSAGRRDRIDRRGEDVAALHRPGEHTPQPFMRLDRGRHAAVNQRVQTGDNLRFPDRRYRLGLEDWHQIAAEYRFDIIPGTERLPAALAALAAYIDVETAEQVRIFVEGEPGSILAPVSGISQLRALPLERIDRLADVG